MREWPRAQVYCSPANQEASALLDQLMDMGLGGARPLRAPDAINAKYFLLHLTTQTFPGNQELEQEVAEALRQDVTLVLVHDLRAELVAFDAILHSTPSSLKGMGLYRRIAVALHSGPFELCSLKQLLLSLGADDTVAPSGRLSRLLKKPRGKAMRLNMKQLVRINSSRWTDISRWTSGERSSIGERSWAGRTRARRSRCSRLRDDDAAVPPIELVDKSGGGEVSNGDGTSPQEISQSQSLSAAHAEV